MISLIYKILPKEIKISSSIIILFILLGTLLEITGIGMALPILNALIHENYLDNQYIFYLNSFFNNPEKTKFIIYCISILMLVYLIKSFLIIFINFRISRLNKSILEYLTINMFKVYINRSYLFHANTNSAYLTKNILSESNNLAYIIIAIINIFSEIVLLLFITLILFMYDLQLTLILISFLTIIIIFLNFISKKRLIHIGSKRQKFDTQRYKLLQKSFGPPIKLIKILGLEKFYYNQYSEIASKYASVTTLQIFLQSLPKIFFELLFIFSICSLIIFLIFIGYTLNQVVISLAFLGMIFFRLMPSFIKLINNWNTIRFATGGYKVVYKELIDLNKGILSNNNIETLPFNREIQIKNLSFRFDRDKTELFKNLNFKIIKGSTIGIIGQSGSGKTTLINLLCGLIEIDEGNVFVDNIDIKNKIKSWQKNIGFVPQQVILDDDTIKKNIAIGVEENEIDEDKIFKTLKYSQLHDFVIKQKDGINTKVGELGSLISGGQLQRLGIARALYRDPKLLVLDESTSNLDLKTESEIIETVNELKKNNLTVIIVSHKESTLKFCDQIINLSKNK